MKRVIPGFSLSLLLIIGGLLLMPGIKSACSNRSARAADLASELQRRLANDLDGAFSNQYADVAADGDNYDTSSDDEELEDDEVSPQCCAPDDPCGMEMDGQCQCPDQLWDDVDCRETVGNGGGEPYCIEDLDSCLEEIDIPITESELMDQMELGWINDTPPAVSAGPELLICNSHSIFRDPYENLLQFGYDFELADPAALIFVIDGIAGYGLLPIDTCGVVRMPGTRALCNGATGSSLRIDVQGALITWDLAVGGYQPFGLTIDCL